MAAMARERIAGQGWRNVTVVQSPAEDAQIPVTADAALFCAVHDILQSPDALRNVITKLVPLENRIRLVTCESSGCQAARVYSLIRPLRTGLRWIRSRSRSATVGWPPSGSLSGTRWAMPWCGLAVL